MNDLHQDLKGIQDRIKKSLFHIFTAESNDDSEKNWLIERTANQQLKKLIPQLSVLCLHTLEIISQHECIKGIDIAHNLNVTKGAISKVTRRLLNHGLIKKSQRPTNLKEIYFSVTPLGTELANLHEQLHMEFDKKSLELLKRYDLASLELVADFLENLSRLH
jgi:DNA-binding MarR family transcriptional regulator